LVAVRRQVSGHINGALADLRLELQAKSASPAPAAIGTKKNTNGRKRGGKSDSPS
jgi:hypothetical protein